MTVTVAHRDWMDMATESPTMIYLDGEIDATAPKRLSQAISTIQPGAGGIYITLNSPGGDLFAGMDLGRIIRKFGASTAVGVRGPEVVGKGKCFSACSLAFLGGLYRYSTEGSIYGVHRVSRATGPESTDLDVGQILSAAIGSYIREMGTDPGLFDLMVKAGASDIYLLSEQEAKDLYVVNNGRMLPEWSIEVVQGGTYLKGVQNTAYGMGKAIFSCGEGKLIFFSVYQAGDKAELIANGGWVHSLLIDSDNISLPAPFTLTRVDDFVNTMFMLTNSQFRRAMSAKRIGHAMQLSREAPTFVGYYVDIDDKSAQRVRNFIGNCVQIK